MTATGGKGAAAVNGRRIRRIRRDLQERILERLRRGDRIKLRTVYRRGTTFVCLTFRDGEMVHGLSLGSLIQRGDARIDDDGEVRLP